jgi:hypothetical protein
MPYFFTFAERSLHRSGLLQIHGSVSLAGSTAAYGSLTATSSASLQLQCSSLDPQFDWTTGPTTAPANTSCVGVRLPSTTLQRLAVLVLDDYLQLNLFDSFAVCKMAFNDSTVAAVGALAVAKRGVVQFSSLSITGEVGSDHQVAVECAVNGFRLTLSQPILFTVPLCPPGSSPTEKRTGEPTSLYAV